MTRQVQRLVLTLPVAILPVLSTPAQAQNPGWTAPRPPFSIADDLHYVGSAGLSAFLFTSDEGHILIDAPLQENVPQILQNIRTLGFDPADIRVLLASHAHFDHVGGLADMARETGAEIVMSEADASFVRRGEDFGLDGITSGFPPAAVSRTIGHLDSVELGPLVLTAHLTPGHTPGCTSWGGEVRIEGIPYEFISVCSLSVLSFYTLAGDAPTYEGQARDYCASLQHLEGLDPDLFLGPHGEWFGIDQKMARRIAGDATAFVEGEMYRDYLAQARSVLERRLAEEGFVGGCQGLLG